MSEKESPRIDNADKAWDMAHAEKPFRDKIIDLHNNNKQELVARFESVKSMVNADAIDSIKATSPERAYRLRQGEWDEDDELSPLEVVKIAKRLSDFDDPRTQDVVRGMNETQYFPMIGDDDTANERDRLMKPYLEQGRRTGIAFAAGTNPEAPGVKTYKFGQRSDQIPQSEWDQPVKDTSRTIVGDLATEDAGKKYDDRQEMKKIVNS